MIKVAIINFIWICFTGVVLYYSCVDKEISGNDRNKTVHQNLTINQGKGIIFSEDFESASILKIKSNWDDSKNTNGMSINDDIPKRSKGKQSLMMTYNPGLDEGGHLFKSFPEGHDLLFVRFYVKFLTRNSKIHHLVKLGGHNPVTSYPQGRAGLKPNGKDFFISGIESPESKVWAWGFYTYWMHMQGVYNSKYWGNVFLPETLEKIPEDEWVCVEFMVKMNNPVEEFNGEQAFWINGKKVLHLGEGFPKINHKGGQNRESSNGEDFEGFQWRNNDKLKLNFFWLNYYMTKGTEGEIDKILFDDIIISHKYIGPLPSNK